jgi:hypothetical protein
MCYIGYDSVYSCLWIPKYQKNMILPSSSLKNDEDTEANIPAKL